jgi:peptidoglycan/LPS O-acetylase OafA/YrhL
MQNRGAPRLLELDALRGIAALQVFVVHYLMVDPGWVDSSAWWVRFTPLRFVLEPHIAVVLFFVLSGFVLTVALQRERGLPYSAFLARRFCRIYIPFAASVLLSTLLFAAFRQGPVDGVRPHLNADWLDGSPRAVVGHLLMTGMRPDMQLNGVMWSLVHELRVSLLLPAMVVLLSASPWVGAAAAALSCGAYVVLVGAGAWNPWQADSLGASLLQTAFYLFPFMVGSVAALYQQPLTVFLRANLRLVLVLALAAVVVLQRSRVGYTGLGDWPLSIGAGGLILAALAVPQLSACLAAAPLQWLGRISYSLYLVHVPVLLAVLHGTRGHAA